MKPIKWLFMSKESKKEYLNELFSKIYNMNEKTNLNPFDMYLFDRNQNLYNDFIKDKKFYERFNKRFPKYKEEIDANGITVWPLDWQWIDFYVRRSGDKVSYFLLNNNESG